MRRERCTPIELLNQVGFLDPEVSLSHCIFISGHSWLAYPYGDDLKIIADSGASVAYSPLKYLKLGILMESFDKYRKAGVNMGIGTDTFPKDILSDMHYAALAARVADKSFLSGHPRYVFNAVTLGGAKMIGRSDLGRLQKGAKADITIVNLRDIAFGAVRDYPGRFGSFASIPFPDTEGCLREIEYALDTLKADGIYLWTSYEGKLLGDPDFWPILAELNRRKVVVYTHPTSPACCSKIMPYTSVNTIEGPVDTTRTMASLMFQGGAARFPDIRWIFSHSGGVTPFLLSRFERHMIDRKDAKEKMPNGVRHELRKFYYDTAQGNHEGALLALLKIVPPSQVLYGTDFPFRDGAEVISGLSKHGFSAADLRAIDRDNATRLFPKLKA